MFSSIPRTIKQGFGFLVRPILASLIRFVLARPWLKAWALALLGRYPAFESWLYMFALGSGIRASGITAHISSDIPDKPSKLTPNARRIYEDLNAAIKRRNKGGQ